MNIGLANVFLKGNAQTSNHLNQRLWLELILKLGVFNYIAVLVIVKLLAKSKLKSLPYNHTDHPPLTPNFKLNVYKSIQVLHQHMRYH